VQLGRCGPGHHRPHKGDHGGKARLEALDRANLFIVRLDDNRRWYRYHHLFADVLHTRLLDEQPGEVADLHRRASHWYDQNGEPSPAVRHALAAGDVERAAGLVELAIPAMRRDRQEATIRGWLGALPDDLVRARPVLAVGLAGALLAGGQVEGVEDRLAGEEEVGRRVGAKTCPSGLSVDLRVDSTKARKAARGGPGIPGPAGRLAHEMLHAALLDFRTTGAPLPTGFLENLLPGSGPNGELGDLQHIIIDSWSYENWGRR